MESSAKTYKSSESLCMRYLSSLVQIHRRESKQSGADSSTARRDPKTLRY